MDLDNWNELLYHGYARFDSRILDISNVDSMLISHPVHDYDGVNTIYSNEWMQEVYPT